MYAWIDGEKWDGDDQPALSERHGWLEGRPAETEQWEPAEIYGRILNEEQSMAVIKALFDLHQAVKLPFTSDDED